MKELIVVDDFYQEPLRVRAVALSAQFSDVRNLNYPGYQSDRAFASRGLKQAFSEMTGEELLIDEHALTFGRFRFMTQDSNSRLKVHVDGEADWTAVVYLTLPERCMGGTAFFRHSKTGLSGPPTLEEADRLGFKTAAAFEAAVIEPDTDDLSAWQQTMFVGMRFNRLLLFRGSRLFHSHTCSWGDDIVGGRLTQNFFFNSLSDPGRPLIYKLSASEKT